MGRYNCKFAYYVYGNKTADVTIDEGVVTTKRYTDVTLDLPFGNLPDSRISRKTIDLFFEEHCVPLHRANLQQILDYYGLEKYDAYEICRITGGTMADTPYRIEWESDLCHKTK